LRGRAMTKKRLYLILAAVFVLGIPGWILCPWPDKTYRVWNGASFNRVTEERRFRWTEKGHPQRIHGDNAEMFFRQTLHFSGPVSGTFTIQRFGFFEVIDTKSIGSAE
jgi:hypothetical protein